MCSSIRKSGNVVTPSPASAPRGVKGEKTLAELAKLHDVQPNQIADWKNQLLDRAASVFGAASAPQPAIDLKELHAKIGQLDLEKDFCPARSPRPAC